MNPYRLLPPVSALQRAAPEMSAGYHLRCYNPNLNLSYYSFEGNLFLGTCSMFCECVQF